MLDEMPVVFVRHVGAYDEVGPDDAEMARMQQAAQAQQQAAQQAAMTEAPGGVESPARAVDGAQMTRPMR